MQIAANKAVSIDYTLTNADGEVLDSSNGGAPLVYLHGAGNIIPGLEKALEGKQAGDAVNVTVEPAEAYGEVDPALIVEFPISQAPEGIKVGDQVSVSGIPAVVTIVSDNTVTVDANHQLAGQILTFEIEMMVIK